MVEATAGRDRHAYGASKRRAVVGREAPAEGGGDGRAWAAWHIVGMAPQDDYTHTHKHTHTPHSGGAGRASPSSCRSGSKRWLLVPARPADEPTLGPAQADSAVALHPPAHAETGPAHDARRAAWVGLGEAHVRHFNNLSLCRELQDMQLQVRTV